MTVHAAAPVEPSPEDLSPAELDGWRMAIAHLADRGLSAIVPPAVADALRAPRRRHLRLVRGGES